MTKKTTRKKTKRSKTGAKGNIAILSLLLRFGKKKYILLLTIVIATTLYLKISGTYEKLYEKTTEHFVKLNIYAGLTLKNVYLEGQKNTDKSAILEVIKIKIGQPLLSIDIDKIKENLEQLPWIKHALIERQLPSTLSIRIFEHIPIAIWQNQGVLKLISNEGIVIEEKNLANFKNYIVLVGEDAKEHAERLLTMLNRDKNLQEKVVSAVRVRGRRWNINLDNGVEIKLPEENYEQAWEKLAHIYHNHKDIAQGMVKYVDLRLENKIYIK